MLNTSFNGSGGTVKAEDVISKLKDDGDFDRLRRKIVRKLKENEELRNNIISMVKESAALNRPGAESMKLRQLSDAIHQEIGDNMMKQISDGLWNIIRSSDGMQSEIKETVESVYGSLSHPEGKDNSEPSSHKDPSPVGPIPEELNGPPGFDPTERQDKSNQIISNGKPNRRKRKAIEENKKDNLQLVGLAEPENSNYGAPPGFASLPEHKHSGNASDEDPDVPPGFG